MERPKGAPGRPRKRPLAGMTAYDFHKKIKDINIVKPTGIVAPGVSYSPSDSPVKSLMTFANQLMPKTADFSQVLPNAVPVVKLGKICLPTFHAKMDKNKSSDKASKDKISGEDIVDLSKQNDSDIVSNTASLGGESSGQKTAVNIHKRRPGRPKKNKTGSVLGRPRKDGLPPVQHRLSDVPAVKSMKPIGRPRNDGLPPVQRRLSDGPTLKRMKPIGRPRKDGLPPVQRRLSDTAAMMHSPVKPSTVQLSNQVQLGLGVSTAMSATAEMSNQHEVSTEKMELPKGKRGRGRPRTQPKVSAYVDIEIPRYVCFCLIHIWHHYCDCSFPIPIRNWDLSSHNIQWTLII